jgi:hypothetical protein
MPSNLQIDRRPAPCGKRRANRGLRRLARMLAIATAAASLPLIAAAPSEAAECNADIGALMQKRQAFIEELNKQAKASPKGQLDPTAACGKLRSLVGAEHALLAYLTKNKEWCMVPDNAVTNLEAGTKRTQMMAANACKVAEQIKKGQESIGTGPKLPAGPL